MALIRPRGTIPLFRSRAPLAVMLYRAGLEGRLLWWSAERFALLDQPTGGDSPPSASTGVSWLRWLDKGWDLWCFLLVPMLLLATAAVLTWFPAAHRAALLLLVAMMGFIAVCMASALVPGSRWLYRVLVLREKRARDDLAVGQVLSRHWAVPLCHLPAPDHADEMLTALFAPGRATGTVLLFQQGVTTSAVREALHRDMRARPMAEAPRVLLLARAGGWMLHRPESTSAHAARGIPLMLFALLATVAAAAVSVADWERAACAEAATGCAERPSTYWDALYWLLNRLSGGDPEGLGAATFRARSIGLLVTLTSLVLVGWVVTALFQQAVARAQTVGDELVLRHNERDAAGPSPDMPVEHPAEPCHRRRSSPTGTRAKTVGAALGGFLLGAAVARWSRQRRRWSS